MMSETVRYNKDNLPAVGDRVHSFQILSITGVCVYLKDIEWVDNGFFGTVVAVSKDRIPELDAKLSSGEYLLHVITGNRLYPVIKRRS